MKGVFDIHLLARDNAKNILYCPILPLYKNHELTFFKNSRQKLFKNSRYADSVVSSYNSLVLVSSAQSVKVELPIQIPHFQFRIGNPIEFLSFRFGYYNTIRQFLKRKLKKKVSENKKRNLNFFALVI